ncbi:hypothetical protein HN358_00395 [Candidatus Uhrbacteria bacterium]|jgi:hypothetical protein|nr:hypothetical protein [Candidatus Uhrbacteria bacterium]MBT7717699.1 hypothetical protein [Candidatus Uhrbacteria bacterium]
MLVRLKMITFFLAYMSVGLLSLSIIERLFNGSYFWFTYILTYVVIAGFLVVGYMANHHESFWPENFVRTFGVTTGVHSFCTLLWGFWVTSHVPSSDLLWQFWTVAVCVCLMCFMWPFAVVSLGVFISVGVRLRKKARDDTDATQEMPRSDSDSGQDA